jgi:hypothetical protein
MAGPHVQAISHASKPKVEGTTKKKRIVEGTTCATIVENPDIRLETAIVAATDCI